MLDVTRKAQAEVLAETPKRPGGNLPDDVKQKFEEAKTKLEEFLKQQKKVIDATDDARQDAGRGFHGEGRGDAQEAWPRRRTTGRNSSRTSTPT